MYFIVQDHSMPWKTGWLGCTKKFPNTSPKHLILTYIYIYIFIFSKYLEGGGGGGRYVVYGEYSLLTYFDLSTKNVHLFLNVRQTYQTSSLLAVWLSGNINKW